MYRILLITALFAAGPAAAWDCVVGVNTQPCVLKPPTDPLGATAAASQAQQQAQTATGGEATATNAGNAQSVAFVERDQRVAASAVAGIGQTTAECRYTNGVGAQIFLGGVSFGVSRKDKNCFRVLLADKFYARGEALAGDRLMCTVDEVKEALGDDCLALVHELVAEKRYPRSETEQVLPCTEGSRPGENCVTHDELHEEIRRALEKKASK